MEFSIDRHLFLDSLGKANKIIDSKNYNPILAGVSLDVDKDKITIISSNNSLSFKSILTTENSKLDVKSVGKIIVKGKYLLEMLRRLDEEIVTLISIEDTQLTVRTDKTEFNMGLMDVDDYPLIGFNEKGKVFELNALEFKKALTQTMISIDEWNQKIILTGLNFRYKNQLIYLSATDMYRISQKTIKPLNSLEGELDLTIPYKAINELLRLLDGVDSLKIIFTTTHATFLIKNFCFQTTLIDGKYPSVEAAFPKEFNLTLNVKHRAFLKALNRADLANDGGLSPVINLNIEDKKIILKANFIEIGNFEEEFLDFVGQHNSFLAINFNSRYLIEAIRSFSHDEIELNFTNATSPLLICDRTNPSLKQIILPTYLAN